jgi:K(+)-stimulated pyrophosphate-energized sodium pump
MQEMQKCSGIAQNIAEGAMAFLKAEYRILAIYVVIGEHRPRECFRKSPPRWPLHSSLLIVVVFRNWLRFFSALAGNFGMRIATKANVRTTQAAKTSHWQRR